MNICESSPRVSFPNEMGRSGSRATTVDPIESYRQARLAFDGAEIDEDMYLEAMHAMVGWSPETFRDFVRKFCAMFDDDGVVTDRQLDLLVGQANCLLNGIAGSRQRSESRLESGVARSN